MATASAIEKLTPSQPGQPGLCTNLSTRAAVVGVVVVVVVVVVVAAAVVVVVVVVVAVVAVVVVVVVVAVALCNTCCCTVNGRCSQLPSCRSEVRSAVRLETS